MDTNKDKILNKDDQINKYAAITKADSNAGTIEAYITTYGNKDTSGDIVAKGALDNFIKEFEAGKTSVIPLLLNHNRDNILGKWTKFVSDDHGVVGTAQISDVTQGRDVKTLIKDGILGSVSVGFRPVEYTGNFEDGHIFTEIELMETSVVGRPANSQAEIISVKSEDGSINGRVLERHLREAGFSKGQAQGIVRIAKEQFMSEREAQDDASAVVKTLQKFKL